MDPIHIAVDEKQLDRCLALMRSLGTAGPRQTIREKLQELTALSDVVRRQWSVSGVEYDRKLLSTPGAGNGRIVCHPTDALLELVRTRAALDLK